MTRPRKSYDEKYRLATITMPPDCYEYAANQPNFSGYIANLVMEDMKREDSIPCPICGNKNPAFYIKHYDMCAACRIKKIKKEAGFVV